MFEIETGLIFWTIVSFVVLLILLYKLVFPPLNKVLEQRRQTIEGGLAKAAKAQTEARDLLNQYQCKLTEAEEKTSAMFEDARRQTEAFREESLKSARKEAGEIIEKTKNDIEILRRKSMQRLKGDIAEIVVDVNKRLIQKELNDADQLKLVETSIEELEKNVTRKV